MNIVLLVIGTILLYIGGEGLVRGASAIGRHFGVSSIIIGLTIVSVGTSSPELAATLAGVFQGAPAISFGNVVGSNIANLGLVLGLTALIWSLQIAARFIRREVPIMLAVSAATFVVVADGSVGRVEGVLLLVTLLVYLRSLMSSNETPEVEAEFDRAYGEERQSIWWSVVAILVGITLLVGGAQVLIRGAVGLARSMGISERVIGLTIVAFGTSLPELASCVVAAIRREGDLVLGNLIGSNIFNILFILGTTATIRPFLVDTQAVWPDLIAMMIVSLLTWVLLRTGRKLGRYEGLLLMATYVTYVIYLFV
jgi:cation:H+ antiporter